MVQSHSRMQLALHLVPLPGAERHRRSLAETHHQVWRRRAAKRSGESTERLSTKNGHYGHVLGGKWIVSNSRAENSVGGMLHYPISITSICNYKVRRVENVNL